MHVRRRETEDAETGRGGAETGRAREKDNEGQGAEDAETGRVRDKDSEGDLEMERRKERDRQGERYRQHG